MTLLMCRILYLSYVLHLTMGAGHRSTPVKWTLYSDLWLTWNEAARFCREQGGHLPVTDTFLTFNAFGHWIGVWPDAIAKNNSNETTAILEEDMWTGLYKVNAGAYDYVYRWERGGSEFTLRDIPRSFWDSSINEPNKILTQPCVRMDKTQLRIKTIECMNIPKLLGRQRMVCEFYEECCIYSHHPDTALTNTTITSYPEVTSPDATQTNTTSYPEVTSLEDCWALCEDNQSPGEECLEARWNTDKAVCPDTTPHSVSASVDGLKTEVKQLQHCFIGEESPTPSSYWYVNTKNKAFDIGPPTAAPQNFVCTLVFNGPGAETILAETTPAESALPETTKLDKKLPGTTYSQTTLLKTTPSHTTMTTTTQSKTTQSKTTLPEITLTDTTLTETTLPEPTMPANTKSGTSLTKTTSSDTTLTETTLSDTTLTKTTLPDTTLTETTLPDTTLTETTLPDTTLTETTSSNTTLTETTLPDTTLTKTTSSNTTLTETTLPDPTLTKITSSDTTLTKTTSSDTTLTETTLTDPTLTKTTSSDTTLTETTLPDTTLTETTLPDTYLTETTLPDTTLTETTLPDTTLPETTLPDTTLTETTLPDTTLTETTLPDTTLTETTLLDNILTERTLPDTTLTETTLPDNILTETAPSETALSDATTGIPTGNGFKSAALTHSEVMTTGVESESSTAGDISFEMATTSTKEENSSMDDPLNSSDAQCYCRCPFQAPSNTSWSPTAHLHVVEKSSTSSFRRRRSSQWTSPSITTIVISATMISSVTAFLAFFACCDLATLARYCSSRKTAAAKPEEA